MDGGRLRLVCAQADNGRPYAVVSRFFAPGSGIPEDPATGSAHCIAGERVLIGGRAVTVMDARLRV